MKALVRLDSICARNVSTVMVRRPPGSKLPALLTTTSGTPHRSRTAAAISPTSPSSVTSQRKNSASAPRSRQIRRVSSSSDSLRETRASRAPSSSANAAATARPIPWLAPVMRTSGISAGVDQPHELGARGGLHELAAHSAGGRDRVLLFGPAHHHAEVRRFDDDGHAERPKHLGDGVPDLQGEPLLHL